jgi:hypothetical protein
MFLYHTCGDGMVIWQVGLERARERLLNEYSIYPGVHCIAFSCWSPKYRSISKVIVFFPSAGRTFPTHPYFSVQLGAGQLSLFNLLKAYSLLDKEVGYCQGISFVAGVLLLHMSEDQAFEMLKFLMYDLGFRKQYRPDMMSLQVRWLFTKEAVALSRILSPALFCITVKM